MTEGRWLSQVRAEQAIFADNLAKQAVVFVDSCTHKLVADLAGCEVDEELRCAALRCEMSSLMGAALRGYTDYVATQIIRSGNFAPRRLVMPPPNDLALIADKYAADKVILVHVIRWLMHAYADVPLLGWTLRGVLEPDQQTLNKWKELYDWSEPAKP